VRPKLSRKEQYSLIEQAERLVKQYGDGVTVFRPMVIGNKRASYHIFHKDEDNGHTATILWIVTDGLDTLMHELGHHVLRHGKSDRKFSFRERIMWEVDAWLWAEKKCRAHSIPFDYKSCTAQFESYFTNNYQYQWVKINWRYEK